ncbi:hypothetical protein [Methylobacterium sp. J-068]|uniref:hypothetical protein n=1 Tax=Methylobacterium sp. J-068 TaxID=2836649 RepID=UPI001FBBAD57|nr:hypothetical protein [Methylobacterium sp. J-068]MCJ2035587.1 hypothetical protein [Methylobacterium sp. J-068]
MISAFGLPNMFTLAGVDIVKASVRTDGGDPSVLIFIRDRTASYLDLHVEDGVRRAGYPRSPTATVPQPMRRIHSHPHRRTEQNRFGTHESRTWP